ncbi:MAG: PAS domain-containing sensor histidine kinase [Bacteroidia bacterium]
MTLKLQYWIYLLVLHGGFLYLTWHLFQDEVWWLYPIEIGLAFSLFLGYRIYRAWARPVERIQEGIDTLEAEDFQIQFRKGGSPELKKVSNLYNQLVVDIREERKHLQEQHFFLERLIDASPNGIVLLDYDEEITYLNPIAIQLLELGEDWTRQPLANVKHPLIPEIQKIPLGGSEVITLHGLAKYKCHISQFVHRGFQRKFVLIEELSRELLATEKMAYGKVIRMMAHEVNNSIGAINSILHSVQEIQEEEGLMDTQEILQVAIDRNDRLNIFMQNFAKVIRLPKPKKEKVNLMAFVSQIKALMKVPAKGRNIDFEIIVEDNDQICYLDTALMEQVLLNLIKNACESVNQDGCVRLLVQANPPQLIIEDNGAGIPKEIAQKLFSPFFSTKPTGQGIGLTLVREVLHQHGFPFSLLTENDGWTRFRIQLG